MCCALGLLAGCASTGKSALADKTPTFSNPFESKKKHREIVDPEAGLDEYDAIMARFEKKDYDQCAKEFKALAKKYYDYPVEEDALYMEAESYYAAGRYAWAQDAYDGLIKKYPSSRYLEKTVKRLYTIGAIWLNGDGTANTDELQQVSAQDVRAPETVSRKAPPSSVPLVPNFFDTSRPLFDTPGNALKALKSVWLHDPLGPLADDALLLTAVYHIRKHHFRDADHYLDVLRREYPKSEHAQTAFVVGSHIKLAAYQGPRYDGRDLVDADDLIHSTLNLYPQLPDRKELEAELSKIRERGAERLWSRVGYYERRGKPAGEAIYCETLVKEFPESPLAEKARQRLKQLGPKYWTGMLDHYPDEKTIDASAAEPRSNARVKDSPFLQKKKPEGAAPQKPPVERLPKTPPRKIPDEEQGPKSYDEDSPGRQSVDPPELTGGSGNNSIEQISAEDDTGRARP